MMSMRRILQRLAATFAGTCQEHHEARALAAAMALVGTGLFLAVLMTQEAAITTALVAGWR